MSDVSSIPDEKLLSRAVRGARPHSAKKGIKRPRWTAVMETFGLGSSYAKQLCERFDLDPDEMVKR